MLWWGFGRIGRRHPRRDGGQYATLVEDLNTDPVVMAVATPDATCELQIPTSRPAARYNCRHGYRPVRTNLPTSHLAITVQPPVLCNELPATLEKTSP